MIFLCFWKKHNAAITPVLHDPSEIIIKYWFGAQETFLIIINKNSCAAQYSCDSFFQDSLNKTFKSTTLIWNRHIL